MMKITMLSGAYKNAGDFLIVDRSKKLIEKQFPNSQINVILRDKDLTEKLPELNESDALILAGGPVYMTNIYPDYIPLVKELSLINSKIFTLGCGWYASTDSIEYMYNKYIFSETTQRLLKRIEEDSHCLSCRDWFSVWALKNAGIQNVQMTGCPAWYDIEYLGKESISENLCIPFRKICISDPANLKNVDQVEHVVKYIRERYKDAEIYYVFHRGEQSNEIIERLKSILYEMGVSICNIEGSKEGFAIYNDCDLHIGYRVHAHIYNLSRRNISILIEEDGRGAGVNHALGLERIKAYKDNYSEIWGNTYLCKVERKIQNKVLGIGNYKNNDYVIQEIENYLNRLETTDFKVLEVAYKNMNESYLQMEKYLQHIERCVTE